MCGFMFNSNYSKTVKDYAEAAQTLPMIDPALLSIMVQRRQQWQHRMQQFQALALTIDAKEPSNLSACFEINQKRQEADQILLEAIRDCNNRLLHLVKLLGPGCRNPTSIYTEIDLEQQLVERCLNFMYNQSNSSRIRQQQFSYYRQLSPTAQSEPFAHF